MDSLPEPSETVEDEWASMKIRFRKEGLDWSKLTDQDRILQVWRWMVDTETNLRTSRIKTEKHANFRNNEREELEDQITKYTKQIYQVETENKSLQTRNMELNQKLKEVVGQESLKDLTAGDDMECGDQTAGDLQEIVSVLDERIQEISVKYEKSKANHKAQFEKMSLELENK